MNNNRERENLLITQIQKGDYHLFAELIHSYQSSLYNFVFRIVNNRDDALDITQDAFFKAYRSIKSFKFRSKFSTWLYQIAYNESVNYLKRRKRRIEIEKKMQTGFMSEEVNSHAERNELSEQIEKILYELKENQRIALHLLYREEKSYKEIAKIMGLSMNTVKTHIRRGREKLRQLLEEIYDSDTMFA